MGAKMNLDSLVQTLTQTHQSLQQQASRAVNYSLVVRNWLFGYYIVEFEQQGENRAEYGSGPMSKLSEQLSDKDVAGCSTSSLKNFRQFYRTYPQIRQTVSGELLSSLSPEQLRRQFCLTWSHDQIPMGLQGLRERSFYETEATSSS